MIVPSRLDWYWLITVHHPYICSTFSVPLPFFHVLVVATGFGCCADCDYDHGGSDHDYWDGGSDFLCTLVCQKVTNPFSNSIGRVPHWPWISMVRCEHVWAKILRNFQTHLGERIDPWDQSEPSDESWMWIQIPSREATVFGRNKVG